MEFRIILQYFAVFFFTLNILHNFAVISVFCSVRSFSRFLRFLKYSAAFYFILVYFAVSCCALLSFAKWQICKKLLCTNCVLQCGVLVWMFSTLHSVIFGFVFTNYSRGSILAWYFGCVLLYMVYCYLMHSFINCRNDINFLLQLNFFRMPLVYEWLSWWILLSALFNF